MFTKRLADWFVYVAVRMLIAVVQALSLETCQRLSERLAVLAHDILRIRRAVVDDNLQHAFPSLSDNERTGLGRRMWAHLFLMVCEIAHAPRKLHITNWRKHSIFPHKERLVRALLSDRPLVMLSGHFGNFELGGYVLGLFGFPTYTIARRLDNPYLDRFVNRFRGATGQYIVAKDGSREEIADLLRRRATLVLLGDQAAGSKACWVEFLGRPASTHKAVAVLSLTSGAPLVVTYSQRLGAPLRYEMGLEGLTDPLEPDFALGTIPEMAQWYTHCLERIIKRTPEQYWWLHRRWKGEPSEAARRRLAKRQLHQAA